MQEDGAEQPVQHMNLRMAKMTRQQKFLRGKDSCNTSWLALLGDSSLNAEHADLMNAC